MAGLRPLDRLFLGYLIYNTAVLAAYGNRVSSWPWLLLANLLAALLPALLLRAGESGLARFVSGSYPLILAAGFYTQLGYITTDLGVLHDHWVQRLEVAVFGGQPSLAWHAAMPNAALSWVLHICYGSYYLFLIGVPLALFLRRPREAFEDGVFTITLGLYACYAVFAVFPVAGPRYFWGNATGPAAAVLPARLLRSLLEGGSAIGTAFPSSHVAGTWCAAFALWRALPKIGLVAAPVALGLALGTVYGQFHYGVDVLGGALVAAACCLASGPLSRRWRSAALRSPSR